MLNTTHTYRPVKALKVEACLTWANEQTGDNWSNLTDWIKISPKVYVMSDKPAPNQFGFFGFTSEKFKLRELLGYYLTRIPGREIVIIAPPDTKIGGDIEGLLKFVQFGHMELMWGAFARGVGQTLPKVFIMNAAILPYVMQNLPENLTLEGNDWAAYIHNEFGRLIMRPRYFDATSYGLVVTPPEPVLSQNEPPVVLNAYDIPENPVKAPERAKRGRPRKLVNG